jgi:hypothetical protein
MLAEPTTPHVPEDADMAITPELVLLVTEMVLVDELPLQPNGKVHV